MSSTRLEAGRVFAGDFRVVGLIAEGGMGTVYEVEQLSTAKRRALKLVRAPLVAPGKERQRFVREATVGASIGSAHVVEVIAAGIDKEVQPWLAMELLVGGDLGAVVAHQGPLSTPQLLETFRQLCHGLGAAHRAGVVHRDLKPANIFVARPDRAGMPFMVKILDFGIAKVVEGSRSGATQTETVGSPMWMAPEQLDARTPSPRTDVWALGLIAFWALTGKHYWRAAHKAEGNVQALFVEQLFKPIDPASERAAEYGMAGAIPPGFDTWFSRCTIREESSRFSDASEAFEALVAGLPEIDEAQSDAELSAFMPDVELSPSTTAPAVNNAEETVPSVSEVVATPDAPSAFAPTVAHGGMGAAEVSRQVAEREAAQQPPAAPYPTVVLAVLLAVVTSAGAVAIWWLMSTDGSDAALDSGRVDVIARNTPAVDPSRDGEPGDAAAAEAKPAPPAAGVEANEDASHGRGRTMDPLGEPGSTPGSGAPPDPSPDVDTDVDPAPTELPNDAQLALVVPMRTQLGHIAHDIDFRGWTSDGSRYAVAVTRVDAANEPASRDEVRLLQVHDALTGAMVESYVLRRSSGPDARPSKKRARAFDEAGSIAEWRARSKTLELLPAKPQREAPRPGLVVEGTLGDPPRSSRAWIRPGRRGFRFRWFDMPTPTRGSDASVRGPKLSLQMITDGEPWPVLDSRVPFTVADVAARTALVNGDGAEQPAVAGRIEFHWSPDGTRVLIIVESEVEPELDDDPLRDARMYLRGAGPQIRIAEAGAGQAAARRAALDLAAAGLPVASIELRQPIAAATTVRSRRGHAGSSALAERIGTALGTPLAKTRQAKGWASATLVLGHDGVR